MMLDKYPLDKETDEGVIVRLSEECSEVIKACCKILRFGNNKEHTNVSDLFSEMKDVELCIAELRKRSHKQQRMKKMMKDLSSSKELLK